MVLHWVSKSMAFDQGILDSWTTRKWIHVIGMLTQATLVSNSALFSHLLLVVLLFVLWIFHIQWTPFNHLVSAWSFQYACDAIWKSLSGCWISLEISTFSIIFAKPGLFGNTLVIVALHSFWCLWLLPMTMLSFFPNYWLRSWASQDMVQHFTPILLMDTVRESFMICAIHGMWFLIAGHSIPEASRVHCSAWHIE